MKLSSHSQMRLCNRPNLHGLAASTFAAACHRIQNTARTDGDATIPLPSKVPPLRLFFEAWQPIAILSPEGRLEGFEGSAQVAITLRPLKHQEMRVAQVSSSSKRNRSYPCKAGLMYMRSNLTQSATERCHWIPRSTSHPLISCWLTRKEVWLSTPAKATLRRGAQDDGDDLLANEDAALRITSDTKANPVDPVTTLRAANDAASTRALEVLRSMLGAKLMDECFKRRFRCWPLLRLTSSRTTRAS